MSLASNLCVLEAEDELNLNGRIAGIVTGVKNFME